MKKELIRQICGAILMLAVIACQDAKPNEEPSKKEENQETVSYNYDSIAKLNSGALKIVATMEMPLPQGNVAYCSNAAYLWDRMNQAKDLNLSLNTTADYFSKSQSWQKSLDTNKLVLSFGAPDFVYQDLMRQYELKYQQKPQLNKKGDRIWGYSYKGIHYRYEKPFHASDALFLKEKVKGFGFSAGVHSSREKDHLKNQFDILYYKDDGSFIVQLKPENTSDEIILCMLPKQDAFLPLYKTTQQLLDKGKTDKKENPSLYQLHAEDEMFIPVVYFDILLQYEKMALDFSQRISFYFDESGVKMKSEVELADSLGPKTLPKKLNFDKPFYLYIKEKEAPFPYFNLWVDNIGILERRN